MTHFNKEHDYEFYTKTGKEIFNGDEIGSVLIDGKEMVSESLLESFLILCVHIQQYGLKVQESPELLAEIWLRVKPGRVLDQLSELWNRWLDYRTREDGTGWLKWNPDFKPLEARAIEEQEAAKDVLTKIWETVLLIEAVDSGLVAKWSKIKQDRQQMEDDLRYFCYENTMSEQQLWHELTASFLQVVKNQYQQKGKEMPTLLDLINSKQPFAQQLAADEAAGEMLGDTSDPQT